MRILSARVHAYFFSWFCRWGCLIHLLYLCLSYTLSERTLRGSTFLLHIHIESTKRPALAHVLVRRIAICDYTLPIYLFNGMESFLEVTDGVINDQINCFTSTLSTYLLLIPTTTVVFRIFCSCFMQCTEGQLVSPWIIYSQRQTFIADYWDREREKTTYEERIKNASVNILHLRASNIKWRLPI